MISVVSITDKLTGNPDAIIKIITKLGVDEEKIKYNKSKGLITSTRPDPESDNDHGLLVYTDSLRTVITTRGAKTGNIITLVMDTLGFTFPRALEWIANVCHFSTNASPIKLPFHGFYKHLFSKGFSDSFEFEKHDWGELPADDSLSQKFFLDNIDFKTQEEFGVRYDHDEDAILIPIKDYQGNLVGCKARNNDPKSESRWYATIGYPKTQILYGFCENYRNIVEKKTAIIFESEKAVMQCRSFGCGVALGIGGHSISKAQEKHIKSLMCEKVIVAFDEGIPREEIEYEAKKLVNGNHLIKNKVFYLYDESGEILSKGSKDSPSDNGKSVFMKMLNERCYEVGA